ncbi:2Fe-2S iron-sulfur cluster-binding protein [Paenibacillus nasutitermitis]|nr:2Fe-2S iron-sulfur cluster-binding protein [Paenibacillus nasutitermitis]
MLELKGLTQSIRVEAEPGLSILDIALKHKLDWGFSCTRGTCARCRCLVVEGGEYLEEITDAEWDRLEPEEFDEGYRLGCQAVVKSADAVIKAENRTYF